MQIAKTFIFYSFLLLLSSCKEKDFLSDFEKNALFSPPTTTELDSMIIRWRKQNFLPLDHMILQEKTILNGKFTFKILSFDVNGIKEYGALLIPPSDEPMPVRLYIGGFGLGETTNSLNLVVDSSTLNNPYILAIPALRGQSLAITLNGTLYSTPRSEGEHCDAFDGATDDALALLNLIQVTELKADVNRSSIRGGSRGGTVALLAGIRDKRIKRVVGVVGPTDFLALTERHLNDPTYQCQFLNDLKDKKISLAEARRKLLASSPLHFARYLPATQLHMGIKDKNVPIEQGYTMEQKMMQWGLSSKFQLFTYDRGHTDIATDNPELADRIAEFLSAL